MEEKKEEDEEEEEIDYGDMEYGQEEDEEKRILEERRKKRMEILEKFAVKPTNTPTEGAGVPGEEEGGEKVYI